MRSRISVAAALLLSITALVGCSSNADDDAADRSTPSSGSTSSAPTSSAATTPTEPPSPTVTPATGPTLEETDLDGAPLVRVRLPADLDWRVQPSGTFAATNLPPDGAYVNISISSGVTVDDFSLGDYAQNFADNSSLGALERRPDRTVQGVTGYVLEIASSERLGYVFGAIHNDSEAAISFELPPDEPRAREWIESVLASVEWL